MDYDRLIEQLNAWNEQHLSVVCGGKHFACDYLCENEDCIVVRAATAIETQQIENQALRNAANGFKAENEQLRSNLARVTAELNELRAQWDMYGGDVGITETYKELERMTAERDAAISDLTCIARTYPVELCDDLVCQYCKHYPNINAGCPGWTDDDCFEWRGIKKED